MRKNGPEKPQPMEWLVFGAGAIGTYIGGHLLHSGHRVTFIEQTSVASKIQRSGLHLQLEHGQQLHFPDPNVVCSLEEAFNIRSFDAGIFALKSYDTSQLLEIIPPYCHLMPPLICFQNGVENEERLASVLGSKRVIAGTVTSSVTRQGTGNIIVERNRGIGLGDSLPLTRIVSQAFNHAGLTTSLYSNPKDMKWSKMLTNLVGNASSAILDLPPAQVFANPRLFQLEIQQLHEALSVMKALGIHVVNLPKMPVRLLGLIIQHLPRSITHPLLKWIVKGGRGAKMPSFHIDLHSGRGQSEVDYLNGAVVRAGQLVGIETPANHLFNQILLRLTCGEIPFDTFSHKPQALIDIWEG